jgi:aspartyl/asparaginyl beta-hydroxylase (cupin superfamily)
MKLDVRVRELGSVDYMPLKNAMCAVDPGVWDEDAIRQKSFEQHEQTRSIILLFAEGWPEIKVVQRSGWKYFNREASALIDEILKKNYPPGGVVIRAMLAKLLAGGVISRHYDSGPTFAIAHRIHVPLITNEQVDFRVAGDHHYLAEGKAYEISNLDYHSVYNRSTQDRVHFIFDYAVKPAA